MHAGKKSADGTPMIYENR